MTALVSPARTEAEASRRPLPWRRMAWVTWRQHRFALTGVIALLGGLAVSLQHTGLHLHHANAAVTACRPASSIACENLTSDFLSVHDHTATVIPALLQAVPALIGAFVAAPVLASELETGTFRYTWTQGFGRWRWTLAKLVPLAIAVTAAAGAFGLLFTWYYQPFFADGQYSPLAAIVFDMRGIDFAAWTLAAFAIGALAGVLIRRVVPAIVATLVAYGGLALAAGMFLREHYLTPLVTSSLKLPAAALVMSQWWTKGGTFAFAGRPSMNLLQQFCPPAAIGTGKPSSGTIAACLVQNGGYTQWTRYHPANRFWPFQLIEGGWLLLLSVVLIGVTIWLVRRRAA